MRLIHAIGTRGIAGLAAATGLTFTLTACGQTDLNAKKDQGQLAAVATKLPEDPALAEQEIERRLARSVHATDGLIVVSDEKTSTTFVYPASIPWVVTCDELVGLSIVFGNSVVVEGDDAGNSSEISISDQVPKGQCNRLSVALGHDVLAALNIGKPSALKHETRIE